ncbi:hypothetical protein NQZ68_032742 [Dissostichus eleginoides]|nr:hypothetical protein NQZ68_032742 [Dissostichus eleginoides]
MGGDRRLVLIGGRGGGQEIGPDGGGQEVGPDGGGQEVGPDGGGQEVGPDGGGQEVGPDLGGGGDRRLVLMGGDRRLVLMGGVRRKCLCTDPPSTPLLYTKQEVEMGEGNVLVCHVTGFYPAPVSFFWTKNGENVTEGTSFPVPFLSKEGSFSQFSRLEFTPQLGDIYSCGVQHLALDQPLTTFWEEQGSQPGVGPAVFCALGLTVGLLGVAAGTFFLIKGNECS